MKLAVLRGDIARVERCTEITTGGDSNDTVKRSKPFKYAYEKEIVMCGSLKMSPARRVCSNDRLPRYAYFKVGPKLPAPVDGMLMDRPVDLQKLDYHSTECIYSPTAYRGHARSLVKDLEALRPSAIIDIIYSGESIAQMVKTDVKRPKARTCTSCGAMSSQELCQACDLLASLQSGVARISVNKHRKPKSSPLPQTDQNASSSQKTIAAKGT